MDEADAAEAGAVNGAVRPENQLAQHAQEIEIAEDQTWTDAEEQTRTNNRETAEEQNQTDTREAERNLCRVFLAAFLALVLVLAIFAFALLLASKQIWEADLGWNIVFWSVAVVIIIALGILTVILSRCICPLSLPLWLQPDRDAPAVTYPGPGLGAVGAGAQLPTAASQIELQEIQPVDRAAPGGPIAPPPVDRAAPGGSACPLPYTEPSIESSVIAPGVHALRGHSGARPRGHSGASGVSEGSGVSEPEPVFTVLPSRTPVPNPIPPAGAIDMPAPTRGPESSETALGEAAAPRGHSGASGASGDSGDTGSTRSEVWSDPPPPFRE